MDWQKSGPVMRLVCISLCLLLFGCARSPRPVLADRESAITLPAESPNNRSAQVWPGKQADGSVLLPNQWSLRPAGEQIELRDFPVNIAVHPSGKYAAVLHSGYSANQISIVDLMAGKTISHANLEQSFYGLQFTRDGKRLFCSGAGHEVVHQFNLEHGALTGHQEIRL